MMRLGKWFVAGFAIVWIVGLGTLSAFAAAKGSFQYEALSERQKELFRAMVDERVERPEELVLSEEFYQHYWENNLALAEPTTFASVTHALENTRLKNGESALATVERVYEIAGEKPGKPGAEQFNIKIRWRTGAYFDFTNIGYDMRMGSGHQGEVGLSYKGGSIGLHLLFTTDGSRIGHVHLDYRLLGEGHMKPYNSDVRAIGPEVEAGGKKIDNYKRHVRWYGEFPGFSRQRAYGLDSADLGG